MKPLIPSRHLVRAGAVAGVALFLWLMLRVWHPVYGFTAFLQLPAGNDTARIPAFRQYPVFVHDNPDSYDGLQYAQIAYHPLLTSDELRPAVDNLAYRAQRILLPALAWLLAAGQPAWIVHVYSVLNIAGWLVLAALLWRLLPVNDGRGLVAWAGLLFSAGVLGSVRFALTDLPALILVAAALWAAERARPRTAVGWLAAAALTRETSLVAWPGLWTGPWISPAALGRNLLRLLLAAAPLIVWLIYIRWRVGPLNQGTRNFAWPAIGLLEKWSESLLSLGRPNPPLYAWATALAVAGLTLQVAFILARPRPADLWWRVGAACSLLMLCLGPAVWEGFPVAAGRVLLPLNLACNVLAVRTRAPLAWLLVCNLTVFSGLMALREVPHNRMELAAVRTHGVACLLHLDPGWYGRESDPHHVWSWAGTRGRLDLDVWPRTARPVLRLTLHLCSQTPRTVTVKYGGRELWRGEVGWELQTIELPALPMQGNPLSLELSSDAPGVLEDATPTARSLGFALYDPVISLSEMASSKP
jgi:hypothetical protein